MIVVVAVECCDGAMIAQCIALLRNLNIECEGKFILGSIWKKTEFSIGKPN